MNNPPNSKDINLFAKHSNSRLIYEYTENYLEDVNKGIDSTNQKVSAALGFTAILLKFSADLPSDYLSLTLCKIGICILLVLTIVFCLIALNPRKSGKVIFPLELLDEWFYTEEDELRLFIARQWVKTIQELDKVYAVQANYLKRCYYCISIAVILFAINILLNTVFPPLN